MVARLVGTMETMHAAGRRNLPPVPRAAVETVLTAAGPTPAPSRPADDDRTAAVAEVASTRAASTGAAAPAAAAAAAGAAAGTRTVGPALDVTARIDAGQAFVARLRAAASAFAEAAGADSAVVREVVPPARHRRSRCRVVLRHTDGTEADLTFVGEHRRPGVVDQHAFENQIRGWLEAGRPHDPAWLVDDAETRDGVAVDVTAWAARA